MKRQSETENREKVIRVVIKDLNVLFYEGSIASDNYITAFVPDEILIPVEEFKDYALNKGYLDYCSDFNDASKPDGHGQLTGTMTWEQYETLPKHQILKDITHFLKFKYS